MAASQRIDDLRRRVQKDPASIAFAQLAEECRRAGQIEEAVEVCRAGLAIHPGYLSARVTLGRALIELNDLDQALQELTVVLKSAPENLAAIRGIAEIHHRRGDLAEALVQYRAALALARNDPDLQQTVAELARQVEPAAPAAVDEGLSFEQITNEFLKMAPPPPPPPAPAAVAQVAPPPAATAPVEEAELPTSPIESTSQAEAVPWPPAEPAATPPSSFDETAFASPAVESEPASTGFAGFETPASIDAIQAEPDPSLAEWSFPSYDSAPAAPMESEPPSSSSLSATLDDSGARDEAMRTIAALEQWIDAIHVARAQRSP